MYYIEGYVLLYSTCVEIRGQHVEVSSLLLSYESQGLNLSLLGGTNTDISSFIQSNILFLAP